MVIPEGQREIFAERGLIRLDGLIPDETVAPSRQLVLEVLEREGVWRDGSWLLEGAADAALASQLRRKLNRATKRSPVCRDLMTPSLLESVGQLVDGRALRALTDRPQVLFTPPSASAWTVPHKVWHLDVPRLGSVGMPGVQVFSFLHAVGPGAGGTLVVAGSHRLLNDGGRIRSKDVKRLLRREPYFGELMKPRQDDRQHFLEVPGRVGDVELQVVELHGEAGDVFLMDMRVLHTLAPNATRVPRLMVTQRFFLESVLDGMTEIDSGIAEGHETRG